MKWMMAKAKEFLIWVKLSKGRRMARVTLENHHDKPFEFQIDDLIHIGYDPVTKNIVICLKGRIPEFLPLTPGNLSFLKGWAPYLAIQCERGLSDAEKEIIKSSAIKMNDF